MQGEFLGMWYSLSSREKLGVASVAGVAIAAAGWVGFQKLKAPGTGYAPGLIAGDQATRFAVQIAGAVNEPKVINANPYMIVQEAIDTAGGAAKDADLIQLNLAAKLQPNSRLYVPHIGEEASAAMLGPYAPGATPAPLTGSSTSATGMVNINTASENELDKLPGVGPVTARKIIEYRNKIGRFSSADQLMEVKGIGPKKLEKMRGQVAL